MEKILMHKLSEWYFEIEDKEKPVFRLYLHSFEPYGELDIDREVEDIDAWIEAQFSSMKYEFTDEDQKLFDENFIYIGSDFQGGRYYLWNYKGIGNKAKPVVFTGGEGEYEMVASSLSDFIQKMTFTELDNYDLKELQNDHNLSSIEEVKEAYAQSMNDFKKHFSEIAFDDKCKKETLQEKMKIHPSFENFIDKFLMERAISELKLYTKEELEEELCRDIDTGILSEEYAKQIKE